MRLTPGANSDRIDGHGGDEKGLYLKVRVRAAPEQGKANAALQSIIAKALAAPKSKIVVLRGATSRMKVLEIDGVSEAAIARLFEQGEHA